MSSNYKELKDLVASYLDRDDVVDLIPTFINQVTRTASRKLRLPTMEVTEVLDVYGNGDVVIPPDLVELFSIDWLTMNDDEDLILARQRLERGQLLQYKDSLKEYATSNFDTPTAFTREGGTYKVYPLPPAEEMVMDGVPINVDIVGKVAVHYFALSNVLVNDEDSNWILDVTPELYLYGTLARAFEYIRDYETAAFWESRYDKALVDIQAWSERADDQGGSLTVPLGG